MSAIEITMIDNTLPDLLAHLPEKKRDELSHVSRVVFKDFSEAQNSAQRTGQILKVILFGSYARGDWVEDQTSGYRSDYDLLIVVNIETWAEQHEVWHRVSEDFLKDLTISGVIETPVNIIVHSLQDVNDQLARGKPFFVDVFKDGLMVYEESGHPLVKPKPLSENAAKVEAKEYFDYWFPSADAFKASGNFLITRGNLKEGAFNFHQATERLYHCLLLVLKLYSPKSHRLKVLRSAAERIDARLIAAWPRDDRFSRRCFERLDRAYVDARYSTQFTITDEEIRWIVERIEILQTLVGQICQERLAGATDDAVQ